MSAAMPRVRQEPPATPTFGGPPWAAAAAFIVAYGALNAIAGAHQFARSGITLWSPDDGLSVLLLLRSRRYWPVVLFAAVFTDFVVLGVAQGVVADVMTNAAGTLVYAATAHILDRRLRFDPAAETADGVIALLAIVPLAAAAAAALECSVLFAVGALSSADFWAAARELWIGDTVGMLVIIPGVGVAAAVAREPARGARGPFEVGSIVAVAITMFLVSKIVVGAGGDRGLLYLMFLPVIWAGITYGYRAAAMAVMAAQVSLVANAYETGVGSPAFGSLQLFMLVLAATGLLLGGVASEKASANAQLLRQRRALERGSAQASLGAAAASLAHELSQPLASLSAYLHAALRMVRAGAGGDAVERALMAADGEAERARAIMARVRDFVAAGTLEEEDVDLVALAQTIRALNVAEAERRGVEIVVHAEAGAGALVARCDRVMVEQALNNLVTNAVDAASSADGRKAGLVTLTGVAEGGEIGLDVADNGPGVDPEIAGRLFDAFESTKSSGMGLGLSLARQIMQKHDGRLFWSANAPSGARFSMRFPRASP